MKTVTRALCLVMLAAAYGCNAGEQPTAPLTFVGPSTLVSEDLTVGTGATAASGQLVTAHYSLWMYDPTGANGKGILLTDSRGSGNGAPLTIRLANTNVIQGWVDGVPGMRIGGKRRLTIPPSLAYGSTGNQGIPPNAWLVFEIELLAIAD